jgi:hypothetical protein
MWSAREVGGLTALVREHLFKSGRSVKAVIPDPTDATRKIVTLSPATVAGGVLLWRHMIIAYHA